MMDTLNDQPGYPGDGTWHVANNNVVTLHHDDGGIFIMLVAVSFVSSISSSLITGVQEILYIL